MISISVQGDLYLTLPLDPTPILERLTKIMTTQAEVAADIAAVTDALATTTIQITKIGAETSTLLSKIADLEIQLASAGAVSGGITTALAALHAQAAALQSAVSAGDALVPDAPV